MTTGTYTVTATDTVTEDTASADFEVEKQAVAEIVIKNTKAYTNADDDADDAHKEAYAYYDVLDQYGESIRTSASIQWAGSCEIKADKANGMLTLKKNDDKAWVYGEQIYITGVYTKTGTATNATLTVDTEQALNSIEPVGFLKKGTSDIIYDLTEDFKEYEYYMLFHALDQNDCPLKADKIGREDVTFISDSPLVVKEVTFDGGDEADDTDNKAFTVKGEEYNAVYVNPGINVSKGGEVNVTAIANKTGKKTNYNFMVGEDPVVVTFTLDAPSGVVADGDSVEIPFTAAEADGTPITNFRALAKQEIFNTLSFNASEGTLRLAEQNDRTAKLTWTDDAKYYANRIIVNGVATPNEPWSYSVTTDDIDRPVSLTVVVVGGEPNNEMLSVQDKRRPNAIADVELDDVYVEGANFDITLDSFQYYDQYGKLIDEDADASDYGDDNGFFAAATLGELKNTDFANYAFGVRIENTGNKIVWDATVPDGSTLTTSITDETRTVNNVAVANPKKAVIQSFNFAGYETLTDITSAATGEGFKFEIAKFKDTDGLATPEIDVTDPDDWDAVSPTKFHGLTVVDITQVKNFKIGDLKTLYTGPTRVTGDKIISEDYLEALKSSSEATTVTSDANNVDADHQKTVEVSGTYSGSDVDIPADYFTIATTKNSLVDSDGDDDFDQIGEIDITSLYDKTTANGNAKLGQDEVVATIIAKYDPVSGYGAWDSTTLSPYISTTLGHDGATATFVGAKAAYVKAAQLEAANESLEEDGFAALDEDGLTALLANEGLTDTAVTAAESKLTDAQTAEAVAKEAADATAATLTEKQTAYDNALTALSTANKTEKQTGAALTGEGKEAIDAQTIAVDTDINTLNYSAITTPDTEEMAKAYAAAKKDVLVKKAALAAAETALDAAEDADTKAQSKYAKAHLDTLTAQSALDELKANKAAKEAAVAAAGPAGTAWDALVANYYDTTAANTGSKQMNNAVNVYDTAKLAITYSDQAPYAADITGILDSYTFNPTRTVIDASEGDFYDATQKKGSGNLKIVDQYGVAFAGTLEYTISNAVEDKDGYAENNFKVSDNGTAAPTITGAEIGDTFDLTVSVQGETLKKTTKVTVGADTLASIVNSDNNYNDFLKPELETQRKAGLQ